MCCGPLKPLRSVSVLLEDVVNEDLKEDKENDGDEVALLQKEAALCPAGSLIPQHADAPANTATVRYDKQAVTWGSSRTFPTC